MNRNRPTVPIAISGIIRTSPRGVFVRLAAGGVEWIPRDRAVFSPGQVIVPGWLAEKIKSKNKGGRHGKDLR